MELKQKINAFVLLGDFLRQFSFEDDAITEENSLIDRDSRWEHLNRLFKEDFERTISTSFHYNNWFTEKNVRSAIGALGRTLTEANLTLWLEKYKENLKKKHNLKKVGVVMAGNIPLVGFHDMLCVLISDNVLIGKLSSQDKILLPKIAEVLIEIDPGFKNLIQFTESQLKGIDAIIATGSNNSARYFEYYFGKYPHIIRKNRNSIAILTGKETQEDLYHLGIDIFQYYGFGCRNVSKIFVPEGYDFDYFFKSVFDFQWIIENHKYANNYDYNKTLYLMRNSKLLDNGFLLLKEDTATASPPSCLFYEYYQNETSLINRIRTDLPHIQCIVSNNISSLNTVPFGKTQNPDLWDYADGIDTLKFLIELNN